jgi:acetolactate synthase-1/2/3 large subunit
MIDEPQDPRAELGTDPDMAQTDRDAVASPEHPAPATPEPAGEVVTVADEEAPRATDEAPTAPEAAGQPAPAKEPPGPEADAAASEEPSSPEAQVTPPGESSAVPAEPPAPEVPATVAQVVARSLRAAGVRWAFTVPGESFIALLEALEGVGINVVATRHEGAASFMAEAHGQLTGRPAVALGTRAVGAANLAIGIHTALADSSPMFAVVGQVDRSSRGREAFQETDVAESIGGLAKWAAEPVEAQDVPGAMRRAVEAALTGRPGPVVVSLAEDLLDERVPAETPDAHPRPGMPRPTDDEVRAVLHLLADARRPVILAGAGVLRGRTSNDLVRFAELLRVPVISSWRRGDVISNDHPLYLGMTGYYAPTTVRERLLDADALLVLGCRLNEVASFGWSIPGPETRWAHVDLVPGRPHPSLRAPDLAVTSDARLFLKAAIGRLESSAVLDQASTDERSQANANDREAWESATVVDGHPWSGPGVHPGRVIHTLRELLPDDGIVTSDAGNFGGWAARGFRFRRPGTFLAPTSGAMGYGLPAAITAALVHRDRPAVALVGDGGVGMTLAELETAVRTGARVVVLVFDNERFGTIRVHQDRRGTGSTAATDLGPVDFAAVARAMGARGVRVETDEAFAPALRAALVADRATLIHLVIDRAWESVDSRP